MTAEEFEDIQCGGGRQALSSLLDHCIRRFRRAGNLVGIAGPVFKKICAGAYAEDVDISPLYNPWEVICERYRKERFDEQGSLFEDHREESLRLWSQFLHWELFPALVREDEFVRNVLRAAGLIPCVSKARAASALSHHLSEMSLPFEPPIWDPAEIDASE